MDKLVFYGTGAAEGIPTPFCTCKICQDAREKGSKHIRMRSVFRLSDTVMIDFGPDIFAQSLLHGSLDKLEHVLITHTHCDHLSVFALVLALKQRSRQHNPLTIYFVEDAYEFVEVMKNTQIEMNNGFSDLLAQGCVQFKQLKRNVTYEIGGLQITPLRGNHSGTVEKNSANYLVCLGDGRMLYYGVDTGYYFDETLEALGKYQLDILVAECSRCDLRSATDKPDGHLNIYACDLLFEELFMRKIIGADTKIYLTHISQDGDMGADELASYYDAKNTPYRVQIAWDGMRIN